MAVAPLLTRWIERLLASYDPPLTVPQYLALRTISAGVESAAELARRSGISGAAVSQLLASLEAAGLIDRAASPEDRRRHLLALSTAGERVHGSVTHRLQTSVTALLTDLPPHDADALARALPGVGALLAGVPPPRRPHPPRPPHRP